MLHVIKSISDTDGKHLDRRGTKIEDLSIKNIKDLSELSDAEIEVRICSTVTMMDGGRQIVNQIKA